MSVGSHNMSWSALPDLSSVPYLMLYYNVPMRLTASVLSFINLITGFLGNILVIAVVLTAKSRMLTPTNCYLVSLSAADLTVLLVGSINLLLELNSIRDHWVLGGLIGCKFTVYLTYVGVNTSAFSITAFSVERYIAICHPITAQAACTVKRAKRIIFGVWLFGLVYNSPWLYLATLLPKTMLNGTLTLPACGHRLPRSNKAYMTLYLGDLALFYFVPLLLLMILYSAIARVLFGSSAPRDRGGGEAATGGRVTETSVSLRASNAARCLQSRIQVVKMLFVVVVMFAVLWLPYRFMVAYNSFAPAAYRIRSEWYVVASRLLVYLNSAINPIIYNAMSIKFRREFRRLLSRIFTNPRGGQRANVDTINGTTTYSQAATNRLVASSSNHTQDQFSTRTKKMACSRTDDEDGIANFPMQQLTPGGEQIGTRGDGDREYESD